MLPWSPWRPAVNVLPDPFMRVPCWVRFKWTVNPLLCLISHLPLTSHCLHCARAEEGENAISDEKNKAPSSAVNQLRWIALFCVRSPVWITGADRIRSCFVFICLFLTGDTAADRIRLIGT